MSFFNKIYNRVLTGLYPNRVLVAGLDGQWDRQPGEFNLIQVLPEHSKRTPLEVCDLCSKFYTVVENAPPLYQSEVTFGEDNLPNLELELAGMASLIGDKVMGYQLTNPILYRWPDSVFFNFNIKDREAALNALASVLSTGRVTAGVIRVSFFGEPCTFEELASSKVFTRHVDITTRYREAGTNILGKPYKDYYNRMLNNV